MESEKENQRKQDLDEFWSIDEMLPKKNRNLRSHADTSTVEIISEAASTRESSTISVPIPPMEKRTEATAVTTEENGVVRRFIPPHTPLDARQQPKPDDEYTPENALLKRVRIFRPQNPHRYYESFLRDAMRLYPVQGKECAHIPFFSHVPQYGQMNRAQLNWYLFWRENLRQGKALSTDYSYLLLYAYEQINLSAKVSPQKAVDELCKLWLSYRELFHQLDVYLPEWICDLCLIHRLPPPKIMTDKMLSVVMSQCKFKEFFVVASGEDGYLRGLMAFCSNYDYRKSKYYNEETKALYDKWIAEGLKIVIGRFSREGKLFSSLRMDDSKLVREAFANALCADSIKCRIEIEFCSFSRSHELRFLITDIIKYIENLIRASIGVRSRLSIYALPTAVKAQLEALAAAHFPKQQKAEKKEEQQMVEQYERLYDLPQNTLSLSNAAEIERASWDTTQRLVDAFEESSNTEPIVDTEQEKTLSAPVFELPVTPAVPMPSAQAPSVANDEDELSALTVQLSSYHCFLLAVLDENGEKQREAAALLGKMTDVLADIINEAATAVLGDILLEETDGLYTVIEDYRATLEQLLKEMGKD